MSSLLSFLSAKISFINSCCIFNLDLLCLVGSVANSRVGFRIWILSEFFIGNILLLKLFRTISPALKKYS